MVGCAMSDTNIWIFFLKEKEELGSGREKK